MVTTTSSTAPFGSVSGKPQPGQRYLKFANGSNPPPKRSSSWRRSHSSVPRARCEVYPRVLTDLLRSRLSVLGMLMTCILLFLSCLGGLALNRVAYHLTINCVDLQLMNARLSKDVE